MKDRTHTIQRFVNVDLGDSSKVEAPITIVMDLRELTDEQVRNEVEARGLEVEVIRDSDEAEGAMEFNHHLRRELARLAEIVAEKDTDAALEILRDLAPDEVPLPSTVKRIVADRRAEPASRFV